MTKIAILSDLHGNMDALSVVLKDARAQGVSQLFVCGDITGYYYETDAVWRALKEWDAAICHGNHETILSEWLAGDGEQKEQIRKRYGSSYRIAFENMKQDDLHSLLALPHPVSVIVDNVRFLISHGTPWDQDIYIYPDKADESRDQFKNYVDDYDVICMGHTHYQMVTAYESLQIINPGSVGQPRSGKERDLSGLSRAQWALYDTDKRSCDLMTSLYDPSHLFMQVNQYDPDLPYLKNVLKRQEVAA